MRSDAGYRLSISRKIVAVIMGVCAIALLLVCGALLASARSIARSSFARDIGILADVAGAHSAAALLFDDVTAATETLRGVAVNETVRTAALVKDGKVFARFDRDAAMAGLPLLEGLDTQLLQTPRPMFAF